MSYREEFFEWVNRQPVYQAMITTAKENALELVNCWLNNEKAYFHYARASGRSFVIRCAVEFCWHIKNNKIELLEKALSLACREVSILEELRRRKKEPENEEDALIEEFKLKAMEELVDEKNTKQRVYINKRRV